MKTTNNYLYKFFGVAIAASLILPSCKKQEIVSPTFDVSVEKTKYAVGEPITFNFSGTADVVQFYSGALNAEYKFKDRTTVDGKPELQFISKRETTSKQENTLSVLISKDFENSLNTVDIQKANWVDITSKLTLAPGTTDTQSGPVDLSEFNDGKPVNVAFHYVAAKDATTAQPKWTIKSLEITNTLADGTKLPVIAQAAMGWAPFSVLNSSQNWTTALVITGGGANAEPNDDWVISQPIDLNRVQRVYGVSVKVSATTKLTRYTFAGYNAPGTYTATFEVTNANRWDTKKQVKEITFTVE